MVDFEELVHSGTDGNEGVSGVMKCQCCSAVFKVDTTESDLHLFLGIHESNHECEIDEFEQGLEYESVMYWDIGYCHEARYCIYHDIEGNAVAWYDNINSRGYK